MSETLIMTILPSLPEIKTILVQPELIQTKILVGQGPAGESSDGFNVDPLAHYILAKS
ncbi:MAG: hypothetical protein K2P84_00025 [Undibacterium sp.]|nr:hypothetical protein [Undibacterium sp.]